MNFVKSYKSHFGDLLELFPVPRKKLSFSNILATQDFSGLQKDQLNIEIDRLNIEEDIQKALVKALVEIEELQHEMDHLSSQIKELKEERHKEPSKDDLLKLLKTEITSLKKDAND